jgi:hypothetical protein
MGVYHSGWFFRQPLKRAACVVNEITDQEPVFTYAGGTLPVADHIRRILQVPQVYLPLANTDSVAHGVNKLPRSRAGEVFFEKPSVFTSFRRREKVRWFSRSLFSIPLDPAAELRGIFVE